jgi:putative NADH-flavin reductase
MRLTVFGATGATGGHLVRQALAAGHEVTAVVRSAPAALAGALAGDGPGRLHSVEADILAPAALVPFLAGRDAVVSAIGSAGRAPTTARADCALSIVKAMQEAGTDRLIAISTSAAYTEADDGPAARWLVKPIVRRVLANPFHDARGMEEVVRASALRWTLMRPPRLTGGPLTRAYRVGYGAGLRGGYRISRADLAHCILASLDDPRAHHTTVSPGY